MKLVQIDNLNISTKSLVDDVFSYILFSDDIVWKSVIGIIYDVNIFFLSKSCWYI